MVSLSLCIDTRTQMPMKTYPYQDGDRLIQLVEKLECDKLQDQLYRICKEGFGNDDTIGLEPADDYVLRKLHELNAANAELLERLAEARESHLAASARDVQTIQRQGVLLERMADALETLVKQAEYHKAVGVYWDEARQALAAYESTNPEPVARLIAAAPDLLEALEAIMGSDFFEWNGSAAFWLQDKVKAVIAKAKGEQL